MQQLAAPVGRDADQVEVGDERDGVGSGILQFGLPPLKDAAEGMLPLERRIRVQVDDPHRLETRIGIAQSDVREVGVGLRGHHPGLQPINHVPRGKVHGRHHQQDDDECGNRRHDARPRDATTPVNQPQRERREQGCPDLCRAQGQPAHAGLVHPVADAGIQRPRISQERSGNHEHADEQREQESEALHQRLRDHGDDQQDGQKYQEKFILKQQGFLQ